MSKRVTEYLQRGEGASGIVTQLYKINLHHETIHAFSYLPVSRYGQRSCIR
jgi:hypothetical protein